ncbi:Paxillin-like protein 1 [Beauveria bassiana D1-5]|uniref:Paxillin-like protein 1 n=1 Tax=Beauveria bassiana D1-5 TaxID=1245745 RepID=A0A0A2VGT5_BEABA|nr:Paxillin-like protein 1 [Beauveria bassiana D1-5]
MALPRESAFLPTIKCSQCGHEVEISMMGEHLCNEPTTPELSPPLDAQATFESAHQATRNKYLRTPPSVDTGAANRYLNQGQLTPVSHSGSSRDTSPKTPRRRSGLNRRYSDDYAPEIASTEEGQRSPQGYGRRPGGYGGFGNQIPEPESTETSERPAKEALAPTLLQRMGELAVGYGGFGAKPVEVAAKPPTAPPAAPGKPAEAQLEQAPPAEASGFLKRINDLAGAAFDAGRRPTAPEKAAFPSRNDSLEKLDFPADLTAAPSNNEQKPVVQTSQYRNSTALGDRSGRRSPGSSPQSDLHRLPSAPLRPGLDANHRPSMGPDTSRRPPPRTSLIKQSGSTSSIDLEKEFGVRNPYHTPHDSMSSGYSSRSERSNLSVGNGTDRFMQRNNSEGARRLRQPPQSSMPDKATEPRRENLRPELRIDPAIQAPTRGPGRFVESPYSASPRDDRYDPAIQSGISGSSRGNHYDSSPKQSLSAGGYGASSSNDRPYGAPMPPPVRLASRDALHAPSRGDCKACRMPITGKSISSADGRLTGKYHKACFVCTTCTRPFSSAEFYVHRDRPYCEIHYHKLNGSLCGACDRGIEGQYAEDEARVKYHVGCFRCLDCGKSLSDGYFEVDGKSYCERDAWRRVESETPPALALTPSAAEYFSNSSTNNLGQISIQRPLTPSGTLSSTNTQGSRGLATRGVGAGMDRGPYGVAPRGINKRMTRIGMM